jgi:hypothetical protein
MKEILVKYIKKFYKIDVVIIDYYSISGCDCLVSFFTDEGRNYKEIMKINVWDMLVFLNS